MTNYNYYEAMKEDIKNEIKYDRPDVDLYDLQYNMDEVQEKLYDDFFVNDSITGNASGSYFCNSYKSRECVLDNMDLCKEALQEFCVDAETIGEKFLNEDWEYLDVAIRCYILGGVLSEALEELKDEAENEE